MRHRVLDASAEMTGQVSHFDLPTASQQDRRSYVLKLTHVARPVILLHGGHGARVETVDGLAGFLRDLTQEVIRERGNIGDSLAQHGSSS
ncbi:MAG: hypothetical protein R3B96_11480 [Pirellulaceae bacterium]